MNLVNKLFIIILTAITFYGPKLVAQEYLITPNDSLQHTLDNSQDGDIISLAPGSYLGNFIINKQITLTSADKSNPAIINANGKGHAIIVKNSSITISHLAITNWGDDLTEENSGIFANEKASNLNVHNNTLKGDGFGIWFNKIDNAQIYANTVEGNLALRSADRGNGIQVANVSKSRVYDNETFHVRDGIYVIASKNNTDRKSVV